MLAYNQESLVRHSAAACLNQVCEPLDIVFSDDASTDGTYEVLLEVAREYSGPHNVIVRRNERNLGIGEHLNVLIANHPGDLYIASAGDDISMANRAQTLIGAWDEVGRKVDLISSYCTQMSYAGEVGHEVRTDDLAGLTPLDWMTKRPYIVGATHAFTRRLHLHYGPFSKDVIGEDQVMVFRALALGGALTVNQSLVLYRDGGFSRRPNSVSVEENWTWMKRLNKFNLAESKQLVKDIEMAAFPPEVKVFCRLRLLQETFIAELLAVRTVPLMLGVARQYDALPWLWRYKKVFVTRYHGFYMNFQVLNKKRRQFFRSIRGR